MPETKRSLDTLIARLLRTESLAAIGAFVLISAANLGEAGVISTGVVAVAVFIGRSLVKFGGHQ